jgi:hypothetical protein
MNGLSYDDDDDNDNDNDNNVVDNNANNKQNSNTNDNNISSPTEPVIQSTNNNTNQIKSQNVNEHSSSSNDSSFYDNLNTRLMEINKNESVETSPVKPPKEKKLIHNYSERPKLKSESAFFMAHPNLKPRKYSDDDFPELSESQLESLVNDNDINHKILPELITELAFLENQQNKEIELIKQKYSEKIKKHKSSIQYLKQNPHLKNLNEFKAYNSFKNKIKVQSSTNIDDENENTNTNSIYILNPIKIEQYKANNPDLLCYEIVYTDNENYAKLDNRSKIKITPTISGNTEPYAGRTITLQKSYSSVWDSYSKEHHFLKIDLQ